jgi:hypothetical protein
VQNLLSDFKMKALLKGLGEEEILQNLLPKTAKHFFHLQLQMEDEACHSGNFPFPNYL